MPAVVRKQELASPFEVRQQLLKMLGERELGPRVSLQVINADHGWPLPWLLRKLPNTGYQATVPDTLTASLIVADENLIPAVQAQLSPGEYESSPFGIPYDLRPGVRLNLLVKKSFWEQSRAERVK